jgi:putative Mn2+ efflux pump MntP
MSRNKELVSAGQFAVVLGSVLLIGVLAASFSMAGPTGTVLDALWAMRMPIVGGIVLVAVGVVSVKYFGAKTE